MRARYESFGGIIDLYRPKATLYVDQAYMRELGYPDSQLWRSDSSFLSAPITAHFAVTNLCPIGCKTCYNNSGLPATDEITTIEAKKILDVLAEMQVFTVAFGGGEPLARADLFELAHYARRRGLTPTLTTNGFYIDHETARQCQVFEHIHVSLDGVGDVYKDVRGVDGFEHASTAIKLLTSSGVSVGINCVVCHTNFDHLKDLVRFIQDCGVNDIIFLRLKPGGRAKSTYEQLKLTQEQRIALYPLLKILTFRFHVKVHVDCAMMPFIYSHNPREDLLSFFTGEGCVGANEITEIQPGGEVRGCSFDTSKPGNALRLPEIWETHPSFERFRKWIEKAPEPCISCNYLELCRGGCHAVAEAITGDFNAPDPECPLVSG